MPLSLRLLPPTPPGCRGRQRHLLQQAPDYGLAAQKVGAADALVGQVAAVGGLQGQEQGQGQGGGGEGACQRLWPWLPAGTPLQYSSLTCLCRPPVARTCPMGTMMAGAPSMVSRSDATGIVPPSRTNRGSTPHSLLMAVCVCVCV